ncbi:multidrug resistance protein [Sphingomonas sp. LH128]|uniref:efflux RND transporter periplasmic adaptor subunit n=1 Tax=Sphingomonas sp. LH128 TaxID=473781 RepID=UPI00027CAAAD|nr:efflux RND transporter periplasmic adaptor subunit [Sphingomonas sp. LH128]EJU14576.1 multidrug resistance protein [Sphingomonas sp. LH128]
MIEANEYTARHRSTLAWKVAGIGTAAILGIATIGAFKASDVGASNATKQVAPIPVVVAPVSIRDLPVWLSGNGSVTPINIVDVRPQVEGQLIELHFVEGQDVQAGQLLARLDPRPYEAVLAQANAVRSRDQAQFANAGQEAARAEVLAQAGAGTSQSRDAAKAQAAALRAALLADGASIRSARLNLEFSRITAPITGRVGIRQVSRGSIVRTSDPTGIVTITQMAPISVIFTLPQDSLSQVIDGQGKGPLEVSVVDADGQTPLARGKLSVVGSAIDPGNGQFQLRAQFDNKDRLLWPGALVSVRVRARTERGAVVVPEQAILTGETGTYVYVVDHRGIGQVRTVKTGPNGDGFTVIREGLKQGEMVVIDGQSRLSPGAAVQVKPAVGQGAR